MKQISFINFLCLFIAISYVQLSIKNSLINYPRKLEESSNETILLGYENYSFIPKGNERWIYFDTYFYLKNWRVDNISIISNSEENFTITSIFDKDNTKKVNFTCINDYNWFGKYSYDQPNPSIPPNRNCSLRGYCIAKYVCEANITGMVIPKKVNFTTDFSEISLNGTKISNLSSSSEALEKELASLKYITEDLFVMENAVLVSQSPTSFRIKSEELFNYIEEEEDCEEDCDSENLELITFVNGSPKRVPCSIKYMQDSIDDEYRYFLESKSINNLAGVDLKYSLLRYTKKNFTLILDFIDGGKNATISEIKTEQKKSKGGLSTGGIVAIIIPSCIVLLGVVGLVYYLSRSTMPPPPGKNIPNTTLGVASSEAVVHQ